MVEVKKNNNVIATFVFDGDGKRVKSVNNGTTTLFVGAGFEIKNPGTGQEVTKYYFAGASRVAMRKYVMPQSPTVNYMLYDHLGSTNITTDTNGAVVTGLRYRAWGEVRYPTNGTNPGPSKYTYTGQYSNVDDFGLMFYNARWYDNMIGRFASADTIIPAGAQGLDRYAYVNNSPLNYVDPSGHDPHWCANNQGHNLNDSCLYGWLDDNTKGDHEEELFAKYNVTVDSAFSKSEKRAIMGGIYRVGAAFAGARDRGETASQAFSGVFDQGVNFSRGNDNDTATGDCSAVTAGGCTSSRSQINFWSMAGHGNVFIMAGNVIHELGHAYNYQLGQGPETNIPWHVVENRALILQPNSRAPIANACDDCEYWQYNRLIDPSETFADMFVAWTFNQWNSDPSNAGRVLDAQTWMDPWMP